MQVLVRLASAGGRERLRVEAVVRILLDVRLRPLAVGEQIAAHTHQLLGTANTATGNAPADNAFAGTTGATIFPYGTDQPLTTLHPSTVAPVGGSQPHTNFQPYLCVDFIISLSGIFPSPT